MRLPQLNFRFVDLHYDAGTTCHQLPLLKPIIYDGSIHQLKKCYAAGDDSIEEFAAALRAHKDAVDTTKSPLRGAGEKVFARWS